MGIVICLATSGLHVLSIGSNSSPICDKQKCLQTCQLSPGSKITPPSPTENYWSHFGSCALSMMLLGLRKLSKSEYF